MAGRPASQALLKVLADWFATRFAHDLPPKNINTMAPMLALAADMSPDDATRAKFAGARLLFGQSAAILAGYMPLRRINWPGRDSADAFVWMGGICARTLIHSCRVDRRGDKCPLAATTHAIPVPHVLVVRSHSGLRQGDPAAG
jgi:hypothetical protein